MMKNQSREEREEMERRAAQEKEDIAIEVEKQKSELQVKLKDNKAAEEGLRMEVDRLQSALVDEERRWQHRFATEPNLIPEWFLFELFNLSHIWVFKKLLFIHTLVPKLFFAIFHRWGGRIEVILLRDPAQPVGYHRLISFKWG